MISRITMLFVFLFVNVQITVGQNNYSENELLIMAYLFVTQDQAVSEWVESNGMGNLDNNVETGFNNLTNTLMLQADSIANDKEINTDNFLNNYRTYNSILPDLFGDDNEEYSTISNDYIRPFSEITLGRLKAESDDYFRKFEVKYGKSSEKLNFVEVFLANTLFKTKALGAEINPPNPWEPIFRVKALAYQYYAGEDTPIPSSPTYQIGLTKYLYANTSMAKKLNHIGIAAAYQYDLTNKHNLIGGMLHISNYDIGVLFDTDDSNNVVIAASFNIDLFKKNKLPDFFKN